MKMTKKIEICSPVGSWEALSAAIQGGADSIYFGVENLNMRSRAAAKFAIRDIEKVTDICHNKSISSYLALNSLIYDNDIKKVEKICDAAEKAGISAVIAADFATLNCVRSRGIPAHISVQMNISNFEALKYFAKFADVVVLARELNLKQIAKIAKNIKKENILSPSGKRVKLEVFVHGSLCVAVAGTCQMSLVSYGKSAGRGECYQPCRRKYSVKDVETGTEFLLDNQYIMSPKDLCCIRILDKIINAGVSILKIEGRGRSPEYVYETTKAYREALDMFISKSFSAEKIKILEERLAGVFNRGFWHGGYYLGSKSGEWCGVPGNVSAKTKIFCGLIVNYFVKAACAELIVQNEKLAKGDEIIISGKTTGIVRCKLSELRVDEKPANFAKRGDDATFPLSEKVRRGDKVYIIKKSHKI
jgi:putative protease